ncbi:unnamed protein product [Malus baccata var. baccata]
MFTIKLRDDNFVKWAFQFQSVLKGYKLFGYFDGSVGCPPKYVVSAESGISSEIASAYIEWESMNMALLSLLLATLTDEAMEYVLGCRTAFEAWNSLVDRYASVSKSRVNHLKTELHTIQKGTDSVDKYLLRLKTIRDQLTAAGELISDNDIIIAGLAGLPKEFSVIRTVILARESAITLKEFRAQLLGAEKEIDGELNLVSQNMSALYVNGVNSSGIGSSSVSGSGSTSNPAGHNHIPSFTGGTITQSPYPGSVQPGLPAPQSYFPPFSQQCAQPFPSDPSIFYPPPYGFGYMGQNPGTRNQFGYKSFHSPNYKGNNSFKSNGGFKGKSFHSGSSSGFQATPRQNGPIAWSGNTDVRTNVIVECQICNKRGHTAVNCFRRNTTVPSSGFIVACQICGKRGHSALECHHRGNYAYQAQPPPPSFNAMAAQPSTEFNPNDAWIVDSGASHHITADVHSLDQVTPFQGSETITE